MPPDKFRVALVQMSCGPEPEQNLAKALERTRTPPDAARRSSACPSFFRRNISASAKITRSSILQNRFRAHPPTNSPPLQNRTESC